MTTYTVYTQKPSLGNAANPASVMTTPAITGITFDDTVLTGGNITGVALFAGVRHFLNLLEKADHRGLNYVASSDAGATFVQSGERGGAIG